jgi:hypothetical protein
VGAAGDCLAGDGGIRFEKLGDRAAQPKLSDRCSLLLLHPTAAESSDMPARTRPLGGAVAFLTAVGCATAVVDNDPGFVDPNQPLGATGGTGAGGTADGATGGTTGGSAPAATGGTSSVAGAMGRAMGGGAGKLTGSAATGGAGTGVATCPSPRMPAMPGAAQGNSGSFDTTEAVCFFVEGTFNAWNCSNLGGRSVTVNGTPTMCGGALPAAMEGGYYFEFGASTNGTNYTSFYWYTS